MTSIDYSIIFFQSNLIEIPIYFLIYKSIQFGLNKAATVTTLANLITHPIVFFIIMGMKLNYISSILLAECFAIFGEMLIHSKTLKISYKKAFIASFTANLISWQIGPMLTYWLYYPT